MGKGHRIGFGSLAIWVQEIKAERVEYSHLKKKLEKRPPLSRGHAVKIVDLFESASRFFLCITNRRNSHEDEKGMHDLGHAVAWERFNTGMAMNITVVARASDTLFPSKHPVVICLQLKSDRWRRSPRPPQTAAAHLKRSYRNCPEKLLRLSVISRGQSR
jgi:hypothetical protein